MSGNTLELISVILLGITSLLYAHQVIYLFLPFLPRRKLAKEVMHKYAILIPARNETNVLPLLLESIHAQDYPSELIQTFVIADNCTDNTAEIARQNGATVFERFNKERVGKGYALDYLLEQIEQSVGLDSFDAFLVFDADNLLAPNYITEINKVYSAGYEAFCGYRNSKNFGSSFISAGYSVWYLHDSCHLNASRMLIGSCCTVNGTGFGFSRKTLEKAGGWKFFTLTEDIEFSTWCASHGVKIGYTKDAVLYDEQPLTFRQSWKQRTRWAQGGFQVSFSRVFQVLRGIFRGGWMTYACIETFALSLWGMLIGIFSGLFAFVSTLLIGGEQPFWTAALFAFLGSILSFTGIGALTVFTQWKRIYAKTSEKFLGIFAFPFFMMTFIPIAVCAPFRKFDWAPIEHTITKKASDFKKKK